MSHSQVRNSQSLVTRLQYNGDFLALWCVSFLLFFLLLPSNLGAKGLWIENPDRDLGVLDYCTSQTVLVPRFRVENRDKVSIEVTIAKASCSCTYICLTRSADRISTMTQQIELAPGAHCYLVLGINLMTSLPGKSNFAVELRGSNGDFCVAQIRYILEAPIFDPASLTFRIGEYDNRAEFRFRMKYSNLTHKISVGLSGVVFDDPILECVALDKTEGDNWLNILVEAKDRARLLQWVKKDCGAEGGGSSFRFRLAGTANGKDFALFRRLQIIFVPDITVSPSRILLSPATRNLMLSGIEIRVVSESKPFKVSRFGGDALKILDCRKVRDGNRTAVLNVHTKKGSADDASLASSDTDYHLLIYTSLRKEPIEATVHVSPNTGTSRENP